MKITELNSKLLLSAKADSFLGSDPFDSLNSHFFAKRPLLCRSPIGLAWIQLHKRSFVDFRKICLVPKGRNPKGIGLFILGLLEDYKRTNERVYLTDAIELADWLLAVQCNISEEGKVNWQYACWGYHFDWNARAFYVPKGKPNIITTVYVSQALFQLGKVVNEQRYINVALDSANFIARMLYTEHDNRQFFAYIPGETAFVHNASLWGAAWVGFVANETDNNEYKQLALTVARQSVKEQADDGSWVYGARHHHQFIDGFHTGYNLEALDVLRKSLGTTEFDQAIANGLAYYKQQFFEIDGTAKYYNNNRYPLDMHCVSQSIFTLLRVGGTFEDSMLAKKIIDKAISTLYLPKRGHFAYQKHKYFTNKINYIRWTQAWVYYSFAYYNNYTGQEEILYETN